MALLDRFAVGLPDPQDAVAVASCASCGGEIYSGETVYCTHQGELLHADSDCVHSYLDLLVCVVDDIVGGAHYV